MVGAGPPPEHGVRRGHDRASGAANNRQVHTAAQTSAVAQIKDLLAQADGLIHDARNALAKAKENAFRFHVDVGDLILMHWFEDDIQVWKKGRRQQKTCEQIQDLVERNWRTIRGWVEAALLRRALKVLGAQNIPKQSCLDELARLSPDPDKEHVPMERAKREKQLELAEKCVQEKWGSGETRDKVREALDELSGEFGPIDTGARASVEASTKQGIYELVVALRRDGGNLPELLDWLTQNADTWSPDREPPINKTNKLLARLQGRRTKPRRGRAPPVLKLRSGPGAMLTFTDDTGFKAIVAPELANEAFNAKLADVSDKLEKMTVTARYEASKLAVMDALERTWT